MNMNNYHSQLTFCTFCIDTVLALRAQHHIKANEPKINSKVCQMEPQKADKGHGKHYTSDPTKR